MLIVEFSKPLLLFQLSNDLPTAVFRALAREVERNSALNVLPTCGKLRAGPLTGPDLLGTVLIVVMEGACRKYK